VGIVATLLGWPSIASTRSAAAGPTQLELDNAGRDGRNWLYADHDYNGQRYSVLKEINADNVSRLAQICKYAFPDRDQGWQDCSRNCRWISACVGRKHGSGALGTWA
jgi:glucose dehydrogenase